MIQSRTARKMMYAWPGGLEYFSALESEISRIVNAAV